MSIKKLPKDSCSRHTILPLSAKKLHIYPSWWSCHNFGKIYPTNTFQCVSPWQPVDYLRCNQPRHQRDIELKFSLSDLYKKFIMSIMFLSGKNNWRTINQKNYNQVTMTISLKLNSFWLIDSITIRNYNKKKKIEEYLLDDIKNYFSHLLTQFHVKFILNTFSGIHT